MANIDRLLPCQIELFISGEQSLSSLSENNTLTRSDLKGLEPGLIKIEEYSRVLLWVGTKGIGDAGWGCRAAISLGNFELLF